MSMPIHNQTDAPVTDEERTQLRRRAATRLRMPTPEEDAAITAAALTDPDNPPLAEGGLAGFQPARRPRGRPVQAVTKVPTTMRLDSDVLDSFKATGSGWQTRVNGALRLFLASNNMLLNRYLAKVHGGANDERQLGEYLVVARDGRQAREKLKTFLQQDGNAEAARGKVSTTEVGNAMPANVPVIY